MTNQLYSDYTKSLEGELEFWTNWFESKGSRWPEDFINRTTGLIAPPDFLVALSEKIVKENEKNFLNICDLGSGPISVLNNLASYLTVKSRLVTVDPLASAYERLITSGNLTNIVVPKVGLAETIDFPEKFDLVYARNSLDHSFDAPRAIFNVLSQLEISGYLVMEHYENEALWSNYDGIHNWNFEERNGDFYIWSPEVSVNITSALADNYETEINTMKGEERNWLVIKILKKNESPFDSFEEDTNLSKFEKYLHTL